MGTFSRSLQLHIKVVMEILMPFDGTVRVFEIGAVIWNDFPKCICGTSPPQTGRLLPQIRRLLPRIV